MKFFSTTDSSPCGRQQGLALLLTAQETSSWPAVRHSWIPASLSIPTSPGKVNPRDAEIPLATGSGVGQNPLRASTAPQIPNQTNLTKNEDLGSPSLLGILSPSETSQLVLTPHFSEKWCPSLPPKCFSWGSVNHRQGWLFLWTFCLLLAGSQVRNNRNMTYIIKQLISLMI